MLIGKKAKTSLFYITIFFITTFFDLLKALFALVRAFLFAKAK
jgi:hypothetical protein